jgi:hypothetical protein
MVAHNAANVSVMQNPTEGLGLSVCGVYDTRDVCELDVAALSPFLDRKVLNVDVTRAFSRPIRVHHVDGSLVILVKQSRPRWGETKLDENGPQVLGDLGGEHSCYKFALSRAGRDSRLELRLEGNSTTCEAEG